MPAFQGHISALETTVVLTADVEERRFLSAFGAQCTAGQKALYVSRTAGKAGDAITGDVVGIIDMRAGGMILPGAEVEANADALPVVKTTGKQCGIAMTGAVNPGDIIQILILPS